MEFLKFYGAAASCTERSGSGVETGGAIQRHGERRAVLGDSRTAARRPMKSYYDATANNAE
ncbi:hypothetical protein [uncultured Campylobacter sp.]|uniref:hypothetical protein n=1 Tax=uncultured Campylobacter sp. TaxID=218934 RepID=UPI0026151B9B|nr:hypothetical protein [uncultured Campylobacter sp.]